MKRRPIATIRVTALPRLAAGCVRVEVECRGSFTGLTGVSGGAVELDTPALMTACAYAHEERCDAGCDLEAVHAKGDQRVREGAERVWNEIRATIGRRCADGVRT